MPEVIYSEDAERDLRGIWQYIALDSPDAADAMVRRIRRKLDGCLMFPNAGKERPRIGPGIRSVPVGNYLLFYLRASDGIVVARIIDGRRDLGLAFGLEEGELDE